MKTHLFILIASVFSLTGQSSGLPNQRRTIDEVSTRLSLSPGPTAFRGADGFQTTIHWMDRLVPGIFVGFEAGYMQWFGAATKTAIPFATTAIYRLQTESGVHPYFGASLGLAYMTFEPEMFAKLIALRIGADFEITRGLYVSLEPRVAQLGEDFLFSPQIGLTLTL